MVKKYPNLLSPFAIGNVILRNRMTTTPTRPHYMQGPEDYPTEATITHYATKAKYGAALVTVHGGFTFGPNTGVTGEHLYRFNIYDNFVQHYISMLTEAIHFYGAKASLQMVPPVPEGYDVSSGIPPAGAGTEARPLGGIPGWGKEIPEHILKEILDKMAETAHIAKSCGFDGVYLHMAYNLTLLGRFLSPLTNKRTDKYGGSLENRARFPLMLCERIKRVCGKDFLIEASITGHDLTPGGWTLEETIKFAKLAEGRLDILQIRPHFIDFAHPTGFDEVTPYLYLAEATKKSGAKIAIAATSGFTHPDLCEEVIASGKADLIAMGRAWIANPDFGLKVYEGRDVDIVPCIRCNKCHRSSPSDPWISVCSVNPTWGMEHLIDRLVKPPIVKRRVAVVGGGPAGMKAALVAAERGHEVVLFEKSDSLGGLLKIADFVPFKWPLRDFKNYLIHQIEKSNVKVCPNTEATPEMIEKGDYDALIMAIGAEPIIPPISGVDGKNVMHAIDVYGNEDAVGDRVVIIGGGEVGVETGIHLAKLGRNVTIVEMLDKLAAEATPIHYRSMLLMAVEREKSLTYKLNARCNSIYDGGVTYIDKYGIEHKLEADTVIIAAGMKPKIDEILKFARTGVRSYRIGDCATTLGNVQKAIRSAFAAAVAI